MDTCPCAIFTYCSDMQIDYSFVAALVYSFLYSTTEIIFEFFDFVPYLSHRNLNQAFLQRGMNVVILLKNL